MVPCATGTWAVQGYDPIGFDPKNLQSKSIIKQGCKSQDITTFCLSPPHWEIVLEISTWSEIQMSISNKKLDPFVTMQYIKLWLWNTQSGSAELSSVDFAAEFFLQLCYFKVNQANTTNSQKSSAPFVLCFWFFFQWKFLSHQLLMSDKYKMQHRVKVKSEMGMDSF